VATPTTDEGSSKIATDETVSADEATASPVATVATAATAAPPDAASPTSELHEVSPKRYAVGEEIGRGGIGRVHAARDRMLDREVALKELAGANTSARRRFVREAMLTARLQHPSIVPIYDAGVWPDGAPFYAMKLVGGRPLSEVVAAADTLDARLALVPSVLAVADAIAYAHRTRIIHRDLKPQNVLVGEFGETIVIDWGLAKDLAGRSDGGGDGDDEATDDGRSPGSHDRTVAGAVLGTPAYMAPEQAAGRDVDERADVYALGALLYFVLTKRAPHEGRTTNDVLAAATTGTVAPIAELVPRVPSDLAAIVGKAMAFDPAARYPSGRELADDLRRFTTGKLVDAHRYGVGERVRRWLRRHRAIAITAAVAIVVLAAYGGWSIQRIRDERDAATEARTAEATALVDVAKRGNHALVAQAEKAADPAEALAWLGQLSPVGDGWQDAHDVAARALSEPTPKRIFHDVPLGAAVEPTESRRFLVAWHDAAVWVADVSTGTVRTLAASTKLRGLELCADDRAKGWFSRGDRHWNVEIDLATGRVREVELDYRVDMGIDPDPTPCVRNELVQQNGMFWVAPGIGPRSRQLDLRSYVQFRLTPDRKHVVALAWFDSTLEYSDPEKAKPTSIAWWDETLGKAREVPGVVYGSEDVLLSADGIVGGALRAGKLTTWNVSTGAKRVLAAPDATVAAIAPDGAWFAIARKTTIDIVRPDGSLVDRLQLLDPLDGRMSKLRVSPGGRWLVAATYGDWNVAVVWDLRGARRPRRLHARMLAEVSFGPRDEIVTIGKYNEVRVWEPEETSVAFSARARTVALSRDARWAVAATGTTIERIDLRDGTHEHLDLVNAVEAGELAISNRGEVGMCTPAGVVVWPHGGAPATVGRHHVDCGIHAADDKVEAQPDYCKIAMLDDAAITADTCSTAEWRDGKPGPRYDAGFTGSSSRFPLETLIASESTIIVGSNVIDRKAGTVRSLRSSKVEDDVTFVVLAPNARTIAVGLDRKPIAEIWDVAGTMSRQIPVSGELRDGAFTQNGLRFFASGPSGTIERIDLTTGTATNLGIGPPPDAFVSDDTFVAVAAGRVTFWNLRRTSTHTNHVIVTEDLDGDSRDTRQQADVTAPALAWRAIQSGIVVATAHGVLTIRDDLPDNATLLKRLDRFEIDKKTDEVTIKPIKP
jgi:hypothetical protein